MEIEEKVSKNGNKYVDFMVHSWDEEEDDELLTIYASGRTVDNKSICVKINNFYPFIYLELPPYSKNISPRELYFKICEMMGDRTAPIRYKYQKKRKLQGNKEGDYLLLQFRCSSHIEKFANSVVRYSLKGYKVHEKKINNLIKFVGVRKLDCAGWIRVEIPKNKIIRYNNQEALECPQEEDDIENESMFSSTADIEVDTKWDLVSKLTVNKPVRIRNKIFSFDIECVSENYNSKIPDPSILGNKIIQISIVVTDHGDPQDQYKPYLLSLYDCPKICKSKDINETTVLNFNTEEDLLMGFVRLIVDIDPDVIVGYNIHKFDWSYIIKRAEILGIYHILTQMSRIENLKSKKHEENWDSKAYGKQKIESINIPGRYILDLLLDIQKNYKFDSYTLDNVAFTLLKLRKKDLSPRQLFKLSDLAAKTFIIRRKARLGKATERDLRRIKRIINSTIKDDEVTEDDGSFNILHKIKDKVNNSLTLDNLDEILSKYTIGYIGKYCVWDSYLPLLIMSKLETLEGLRQMSNITCVPMSWLQLRGQQVKVLSQVYKRSLWGNYVIGDPIYEETTMKRYIGATVFDITTGYHRNVATLDFASLYPSIIIAYNICWSTFVKDSKVPDEECNILEWTSHVGCEHDPEQKENLKKAKDIAKRNEDEENLKDYILCGHYRFRFKKAYIDETTGELKGQGILPRLLKDVLAERKQVKKKMAETGLKIRLATGTASEKDIEWAKNIGLDLPMKSEEDQARSVKDQAKPDPPMKYIEEEIIQLRLLYTVLDKLQLALKISANSAYGGLGVRKGGKIPLMEGAACVTAMGRKLIQETAVYTTTKFPTVYRDETLEPKVVGGDTDSVFLKFIGKNVQESFTLSKEASKATTHHLKCILLGVDDNQELTKWQKLMYDMLPIDLEFECLYHKMLMVTKKKYLTVTVNEKGEVIGSGVKGLITARKDNSRIARNIYSKVSKMALEDKTKDEIYDAINSYLLGFFTRQFSIKDFIIYKGVKDIESYKSKTAVHVLLGQKMLSRGTSVPINTKMDYVMLWDKMNEKKLQGERAEDYTYFRDNRVKYGLKLDYVYYIEHQLMKPLNQLLDTRYPGSTIFYTDPKLYIFGIIDTLPITIQRKVKEEAYRDKDRIELLKEESESRAKIVKDNKKYLLTIDLSDKYLEAYSNKDEDTKKQIIYKLFGHVYCLPNGDRKVIDRQRNIQDKIKYIIKNFMEYKELSRQCLILKSRDIISRRCKLFNVPPPKLHKPSPKSTIIIRDENFIKDIHTTHYRYREVIEQINTITGPFQIVD